MATEGDEDHRLVQGKMIDRFHSLWQDGRCKYGHDDSATSYDTWMADNAEKNHTGKIKEDAISVMKRMKKWQEACEGGTEPDFFPLLESVLPQWQVSSGGVRKAASLQQRKGADPRWNGSHAQRKRCVLPLEAERDLGQARLAFCHQEPQTSG